MGLFDRFSSSNGLSDLKVEDAIRDRQEQAGYQDCTPCRLMGAAAFTGLGAYTYWSGKSQLQQRQADILRRGGSFSYGARLVSIYALSFTLVGLGVYRMRN